MQINTGLEGMFNGGAVQLNSEPSVQFYAQLMAHQQAKRDALDQYYQKVLADTNSTGMYTNDITSPGGFADQYNKLQEFAINPDNRKYLENPRLDQFKTATQFNQLHNQLMNFINQSKDKSKQLQDIYELHKSNQFSPTGYLQNPNDPNSITPGSDLDVINRLSLPLTDPNRNINGKPADISMLSFNRPGLNPAQTEKHFRETYGDPKLWTNPDPKSYQYVASTNQVFQPTKSGYGINPQTGEVDNTQLQQKAQTYAGTAPQGERDQAQKDWHDPTLYNISNTAYSKVFPGDIVDSPDKYLMGKSLAMALSRTGEGNKTALNAQQAEKWRLQNIYARNNVSEVLPPFNREDYRIPGTNSFDLTQPLQGIDYSVIINGKKFASPKTVVNADDKSVTVTDPTLPDGQQTETIPITKYLSNINTANAKDKNKIVQYIMNQVQAPQPSKSENKNRPPLNSFIK